MARQTAGANPAASDDEIVAAAAAAEKGMAQTKDDRNANRGAFAAAAAVDDIDAATQTKKVAPEPGDEVRDDGADGVADHPHR